MSGTPGDAHIWTATTDPVPVAACGYTPPVEDIMGADPTDPDNEVVIGQQVVHAEPTGNTCGECIGIATPADPDDEPED